MDINKAMGLLLGIFVVSISYAQDNYIPFDYFEKNEEMIYFGFTNTSPNRFYYIDATMGLSSLDSQSPISPSWSNFFRHVGVGEMYIELPMPSERTMFFRALEKRE